MLVFCDNFVFLFFSEILCPDIIVPDNTIASDTSGSLLGSEISFSCEDGYGLVGPNISNCIEDGADNDTTAIWEEYPECRRKYLL